MRSDEEIKKFIEYWSSKGVQLPSPTNYPKCFEYYVKMYKFLKKDNE